MNITTIRTTNPKEKPDQNNLGFGKYFTDHMFTMDYSEEKGWHNAMITPFSDISISPAAMVFHYGQALFEGMKAYRAVDGGINLFRPKKNMERLNSSADRICIPEIDEDFALEALVELIKVDEDWIPTADGTALYIRPFIIGTDPFLGVHPSHTYKFIIILSPVGAYYPNGIAPTDIYVESEYVRAVRGGTGYAKVAANYAISLKAQVAAQEKGYVQVLWLDGVERKYVEEVGAMNVFFKINGEVVTPSLEGSILPGVTRNSVIQLLKSINVPVSEKRITPDELYEAHSKGLLEEAFGTGTAAVISPIGSLNWKEQPIKINNGEIGELSQKLYDTITSIQYGKTEDTFDWIVRI